MSRKVINFSLVCLLFLLFTVATNAECLPDRAEIEWLDKTFAVWKKVRSESLHLPKDKLPWLVLFDEKCVLNINPDAKFFSRNADLRKLKLGGEMVEIYSAEHLGKIVLPDSAVIPANLTSFAATYNGGVSAFFAAALPTIWLKAPHLREEKNVSTLVRSAYVHELTHTYHRKFFSRLDAIEKNLKDIEVFDDDVVQNVFGKDETFRDAYLSEISLAAEAVGDADKRSKRKDAVELTRLINERREKFFRNENLIFSEVEDIFLTMEGVANWAAYKAAMLDGLSPSDASKLIRRGGKYWSQEQGILLFLLIDDLVPNWQRNVFGSKNMSITGLLERAGRR